MFHVGFRLLGCHDGRDVFEEVDAALLAGAAMALFVLAGRALIPQRSMASLAKTSDIASVATAFRTLHSTILLVNDAACSITQAACNDSVTCPTGQDAGLGDHNDFFCANRDIFLGMRRDRAVKRFPLRKRHIRGDFYRSRFAGEKLFTCCVECIRGWSLFYHDFHPKRKRRPTFDKGGFASVPLARCRREGSAARGGLTVSPATGGGASNLTT